MPTPAPPGHIETHSGQWVDPMNVDPVAVYAEDIAYALSNESRFGGHVRRSVADHSIMCAMLAKHAGGGVLACLHALLHDAHEYVLRDFPKPVKDRPEWGFYRNACDRAQEAILVGLGVRPPCKRDTDLVSVCDKLMMLLEAENRLPSRGRRWACVDEEFLRDVGKVRHVVSVRLLWPWDPARAEQEWMERYLSLRTEVGR